MIEEFQKVRDWGTIRGLGESTFHQQFQRVLQEIVEIHEAHTDGDMGEISDAIGDSIVTLINLARTVGLVAEDCVDHTFWYTEFHEQYQHVLQEIVGIHAAHIENDINKISDAIGGSIGALGYLARTVGLNAEDCLKGAFGVIQYRKGLTMNGSFVRYGKLPPEDQKICDEQQGSPGSEYFEDYITLTPNHFKKG